MISSNDINTIVVEGNGLEPQFLTPISLNNANSSRMVIGAKNAVFESFDYGNTAKEIGAGIQVANLGRVGTKNIAYGSNDNEEVLYIGGFIFNGPNGVFVRTSQDGPLVHKYTPSNANVGRTVNSIVVNKNNAAEAFLLEDSRIMRTTNYGNTWSNITGNIADNTAVEIGMLRSVEFIDGNSLNAIVVGTDKLTFIATSNNYTNWVELGFGLPPAPIWSLEYNKEDDVLIAGTFGRGEYLMKGPISFNNAPQGADTKISLYQGASVSRLDNGASNLLDNFTDPDSNQFLTIQTTPEIEPSNGIVTINSDGTFNYQHDGSFTDSDFFYYRVCDNYAPKFCNDAKVDISINLGFKAIECSNPNITITDNSPTGISDTLTMMQAGEIIALRVGLEINHTWVGDITATLTDISSGKEVVLIDRPGINAGTTSTAGCSLDDISVKLDDAAPTPAEQQCESPVAIDGRYYPIGSISDFNSEQLQGSWVLKITDSAPVDEGALISWCLDPVFRSSEDSPILNPIGDKQINELETLTFAATATDPDTIQGNLSFSLDNSLGPLYGAKITPSGEFSFTPSEALGPATYSYKVVVTDNDFLTSDDSEIIMITINEINQAPTTSNYNPNQFVKIGELLSFNINAIDEDLPEQTLSYSLSPQAPVGASISTTGTFSFTPTANQANTTFIFDVVVSDNYNPPMLKTDTITIIVGGEAVFSNGFE